MKQRQAMLLNGLQFNSEVWHAITEAEIKLVGAHAKTTLEFLYLEAGAIPLRFILSFRRMIKLHTILKRHANELTK